MNFVTKAMAGIAVAVLASTAGLSRLTAATAPASESTPMFSMPEQVDERAAPAPAGDTGPWDQGITMCVAEASDDDIRGSGALRYAPETKHWVVVRYGKHAEPVRVGLFHRGEIWLGDTPGVGCGKGAAG